MALEGVTTLILDDNAHMRGLVRAILVSFSVGRIEEAETIDEAARLLRETPIDIALVDFKLESDTGLEFCRFIRHDARSPNVYLPIIMVTAYSERSRVVEAINSGVDEFLVKPIRAVDVANRMNAIIERRRPFVRTPDFFGPDRRRRADPDYAGPKRRFDDEGFLSI